MFHHAQKCNQAAAPFGFWCKFQLKFIVVSFKRAEWYHLFTAIGKLGMRNSLCVSAWAMVQFQAKMCMRGEKMKINYINGWKLETFFPLLSKLVLWVLISDPLYWQGQEGCQHLCTHSLMLCRHAQTSLNQSEPVRRDTDGGYSGLIRLDGQAAVFLGVITHPYSRSSVPTTLHTEQPASLTLYSWTPANRFKYLPLRPS